MSQRFDVVIGNPPYQDGSGDKEKGLSGSKKNLYSAFITKSIELLKPNGYLSYICPPGYIKTTSIEKPSPLFKLIQQYNLISVDFNCKKYFPTVSLPVITRFLLQNTKEYKGTDFGSEVIDISPMDYIPIHCSKDTLKRLEEVVSKKKTLNFKRDDSFGVVNRCIKDKTNFVVIAQVSPSKLEVCVNDVLINKKGNRKPVHVMVCDNTRHAERIGDIMRSENATFLNTTLRYGDGNVYPGIINYLNYEI